jgi:DNA-directed RNA polymerase subunit M/transcription elongation factor TFIIS
MAKCNMVQFCPNCRLALFMVKEGDAVVVKCYKCGYKSTPASRTVGPKLTTEKTVHVVERTPEYVDRVCPKCGNNKATRVNVLTVGDHAGIAQERSGAVYRCLQCNATWRDAW